MKKILLIVAMFSITFAAGAQNTESLISKIDKAKAAVENPKKASKPATWMKLGDAYLSAYNEMRGFCKIGFTQTDAAIFTNSRPVSTENITMPDGTPYLVEHYKCRDLYYANDGKVAAIIVTEPLMEESLLANARDAFLKAAELDEKGSKKSDISEKLNEIRTYFIDDAYSFYMMGDNKNAAPNFEGSLACWDNPVFNNAIDSMMVYYTGITYNMMGNYDKAKTFFNKCMEIGYKAQGDVPAVLAEIAKNEGNIDLAKQYLNDAFKEFPTSQPVLISLINIYLESKDDPEKILELIRTAQKNEPSNASLVYAEGNVYKSLKNYDKAIECYQKSYDIDNNYIYSVYAVGNTWFDRAIEVQDKMNTIDINDVEGYERLLKEFEEYLLNSAEPFEISFEKSKDNPSLESLAIASASALKQVYFRFRTTKPEYQEAYEKYNNYLKDKGVE